jgi:hypothetical protein
MENIDDVETVKKILRFFRSKRNLTSKEVDHEVAEMRISRYVFFFGIVAIDDRVNARIFVFQQAQRGNVQYRRGRGHVGKS